jgi:hypothetical protein
VRLAAAILVLVVTGCANDRSSLAGRHTKNGGLERVERLGVMTTSELPAEHQCSTRQIRWCSDRGGAINCKCVYVREAEDRVRRMARELRNQSLNN